MSHEHSIYDTDPHFSIDPATREITNQSGKVVLMQYDHNSERFTFELPKLIDGHDMSLCNRVRVHYINIDAATKDSNAGVYPVDDLQLSPNSEDVVICSWLVSQSATKLVGSLNFRIEFACIADDGTTDYAWHTAVHKGIAVSDGIYNSEIILEEYVDVLEAWRSSIDSDIAAVRTALDTHLANIPITRIDSPDRNTAVSLRSLASGLYMLEGWFKFNDNENAYRYKANSLYHIYNLGSGGSSMSNLFGFNMECYYFNDSEVVSEHFIDLRTLQNTNNLATAITSPGSDTEYPTTKAVVDYVAANTSTKYSTEAPTSNDAGQFNGQMWVQQLADGTVEAVYMYVGTVGENGHYWVKLGYQRLYIIGQPEDATVPVNETAVFSVSANGLELTYQWQYLNPGQSSWKNCTETTSANYNASTMPVSANTKRNGNKYRCIITAVDGESVVSEPATLTITDITEQTPATLEVEE